MKKMIIITLCILGLPAFAMFGLHEDAQNSARLLTSFAPITKTAIEESENEDASLSHLFWMNSGAYFFLHDTIGSTIQGELPSYSKWRLLYAQKNPIDTDNGYHPQNLFRLLTKQTATNVTQTLYTKIIKDNLSESPNRNESNGIFLMQRYQKNGDLYYLGMRVDGTIVIKKKQNGVYTTLAQQQLFGNDFYDRSLNPNLIPKNTWIGLRTTVQTDPIEGSVSLTLEVDTSHSQNWIPVLFAIDAEAPGNTPIYGAGHGGIRSDFMDMEFKEYSFKVIP